MEFNFFINLNKAYFPGPYLPNKMLLQTTDGNFVTSMSVVYK